MSNPVNPAPVNPAVPNPYNQAIPGGANQLTAVPDFSHLQNLQVLHLGPPPQNNPFAAAANNILNLVLGYLNIRI